MDRNPACFVGVLEGAASLSVRRAWIEMPACFVGVLEGAGRSP